MIIHDMRESDQVRGALAQEALVISVFRRKDRVLLPEWSPGR